MALSGNKGEWSEIYAFLKILGDGGMYAGDPELNKLSDVFYPIIKILREENSKEITYENSGDIIIVQGAETLQIDKATFIQTAEFLYKVIVKSQKSAAFPIPEVVDFMNKIECTKLKADNKLKSDIRIIIHDFRTGQRPLLGFSIKSKIGSDSTIVNSSQASNFIFQLDNVTPEQISKANKLMKIRKKKDGTIKEMPDLRGRVSSLISQGVTFSFKKVEESIYENNMILISDNLPKIIAQMLIVYYSSGISNSNKICDVLNKENPLNYDFKNNHDFYKYKIKKFLLESALGMVAKKVWSGYHDATGGYIVVKEDGEILCYHLYNRNDFEDYLLLSTRFDTPSTSRNKFGEIYLENGVPYIKLNIQVKYS